MPQSLVANALTRVFSGLLSSITSAILIAGLLIWDLGLTLYNAAAPLRPANRVVPAGCVGEGGLWPQHVPPKETDSRSCCPGLNAMANHGILPHSGRGIRFRALSTAVHTTFNFSPSFSFFVPHFIAQILGRSYWTDTFDLADISVHNCIEHDASLTRADTFHSADQGRPDKALVEALLASGTGPGGDLTSADIARLSGARRTDSRRTNGQFSLTASQKLFGSSNSSTLLTIFGGRVRDLRPILLEERLPDGWQPRVRHPMGLTITAFQKTVLSVEMGIKEEAEIAINSWKWPGGPAVGDGKKAA